MLISVLQMGLPELREARHQVQGRTAGPWQSWACHPHIPTSRALSFSLSQVAFLAFLDIYTLFLRRAVLRLQMAWVSFWSEKCASSFCVEPTRLGSVGFSRPLQLSSSLLDWKTKGAARLESALTVLLERLFWCSSLCRNTFN